MEYYIVSEEELLTLIEKTHSHKIDYRHFIKVNNFLEGKQEIEMIAEGIIDKDEDSISLFVPESKGCTLDITNEIYKSYQGKSIKIYIQEDKGE